jgi:hypothetical protein
VDVGMPFKYVLLMKVYQLLNSGEDLENKDVDINDVLALFYNQVFAVAQKHTENFPAFFGDSQGQLELKARTEYDEVFRKVTEKVTPLATPTSKTYNDLLKEVCLEYRNGFFIYSLHVAMWKMNLAAKRPTFSKELSLNGSLVGSFESGKHIDFGPVEASFHSDWDARFENAKQALAQKITPARRFDMKALLSQRLPHKKDKSPPKLQKESTPNSWLPTLPSLGTWGQTKTLPNKTERSYLHFDDAVDTELEKILAKLPKKGGRARSPKTHPAPGTYRLTVRRTQEAD